MDQKDLTVIIPTLNEEKNIGILCDRILKILPDSNIIVVDDGSTDRTQQIVREMGDRVLLIDRGEEEIHGLTISIRDGILKSKTLTFMVIDGDLQHPAESLQDALECFKRGGEVIIGYRIKVEDWPILRKLISWGAASLGYMALLIRGRQRPKDLMSGFFGANKEVVRQIIEEDKITHKGYKFLFDLLKILPKSVKIEQFGYVFKNREFGDSKIGKKQMWEFFKSLF